MLIYVDIDGTICEMAEDLDYSKSKPFPARIERINDLYDDGNEIVYYTARGTKTGIDWKTTTEKQLHEWKCKYHKLVFGKPYYDFMICDRCYNANDYFEGIS